MITLDGTLGITSPAETVQGALTTTGNTILGDASADTLNVGNGGLVKDASGNVGIGTASPAYKLDVQGSIGVTISSKTAEFNAVGGSIYSLYNDATKTWRAGAGIQTAGVYTIYNATDAVTTLNITAAGLLQFNSGYGSAATAYGCRAWVNFNGTGTVAIRASGNVSSITDNGTGDYTVNFTTALVDANYSTTGAAGVSGTGTGLMGSWFTANRDQTTGSTVNPTTSAVRVGALTSSPTPSAVDVPHMLVAIFR